MRAIRHAWILALAAAGCLEYSPHQLPTDPGQRDLNAKAVARIVAAPVERVTFAVVGDTQRSFDASKAAVESINRRGDVQFVVQIGDFTNVGLWLEFREMHEIFSRLHVPYLVVVGVHDLFGNGQAIYEAMYGPRDFAFTHGRTRFVVFDSNSSHHGKDGSVPDVPWLASQLAPGPDHDRALALSHVAPGQGGTFDEALTGPVLDLFASSGVDLAVSGHAHRYEAYEAGGIRIVLADSVEHRSYLVVSQREDGGYDFERVFF